MPVPSSNRPSQTSQPMALRSHQQTTRPTKQTLLQRIKRFSRYLLLRFIRLKGSSETIARGLAVGAFAGMFPIFGGQTIIGVLLAFLVKGNKVAAMAATWISNPLTYIPIYALNYHIGRRLLNAAPATINQQNIADVASIMEHGREFAVALLLGSCVTGLIMGLFAYLVGHKLSFRLKHYYRKRRLKSSSQSHSRLMTQTMKDHYKK